MTVGMPVSTRWPQQPEGYFFPFVTRVPPISKLDTRPACTRSNQQPTRADRRTTLCYLTNWPRPNRSANHFASSRLILSMSERSPKRQSASVEVRAHPDSWSTRSLRESGPSSIMYRTEIPPRPFAARQVRSTWSPSTAKSPVPNPNPPGVLALGLELIPDGFVLWSLGDLGSGISPLPTGGYLEHQPADFSGIDLVAVHLHGVNVTD